MTTLMRRVLPACAGGVLFLVLAVLWLAGAHRSYAAFFSLLGVASFRFPFLDTHAVLAAIECHRLGIDVYAINPCDVLGRRHVYSPLWLHIAVLPVTTSWTQPVGLMLDLSFLTSLMILPPARRPAGVLIVVAAVMSPAVVYALERGNNDLLIFLLAILGGWLAMRSSWLRLLCHTCAVLAAALKFYPVTLLILAWRERWPRCLAIIVLSLSVLALCLLSEKTSLLRALEIVPKGTFGAPTAPSILITLFGWPAWSRALIQGPLVLAMALRAIRWSYQLQPGLARLPEAERVFLTVGATLIVGCFLAGGSNGYRAIHLLFTLPALLALAAEAGGRIARVAVALVVLVMWGDALRGVPGWPGMTLWWADQCAWWVVVTVLLASLLALLRDSQAVQSRGSLQIFSRRGGLARFNQTSRG